MKIKTLVILEVIFSVIAIPLLYFIFGAETLIRYAMVIYFCSIFLLLVLLFLLAIFSRKIAWNIEPEENNEKILELGMNQFLTVGIALLSFGLAAILSAVSLDDILIKNLLFIIAIIFVAMGLFVFIGKFMPWRTKLLIKYRMGN